MHHLTNGHARVQPALPGLARQWRKTAWSSSRLTKVHPPSMRCGPEPAGTCSPRARAAAWAAGDRLWREQRVFPNLKDSFSLF